MTEVTEKTKVRCYRPCQNIAAVGKLDRKSGSQKAPYVCPKCHTPVVKVVNDNKLELITKNAYVVPSR